MKKLSTIKIKPENYDRLNFMAGVNRTINSVQVAVLKSSVKKWGILRDIIVVKTKLFSGKNELYIIDGQHLFTALTLLEESFSIKVLESNDLDDIVMLMADLNTSAKSWTTENYLNAWCSTGRNAYVTIRDINCDDSTFTLNDIINIYMVNDFVSFRLGDLEIDKQKGDNLRAELTDIFSIIPRNSHFIKKFKSFRSANDYIYNHKAFLKSLKYHRNQFLKIKDGVVIQEMLKCVLKDSLVAA